jgi:hypothetical protein
VGKKIPHVPKVTTGSGLAAQAAPVPSYSPHDRVENGTLLDSDTEVQTDRILSTLKSGPVSGSKNDQKMTLR